MGMKTFVKTPEFASLNIGFALDEGLACNDDTFSVYYGERTIWRKSLQTVPGYLLYNLTFIFLL